jgi:hypothetical protein
MSSTVQSTGSNFGNINNSLSNTMSGFSKGDGGPSFLQSNGAIAKVMFLIMVLILFMFILNLGVSLISFFLKPSTNPYLVKGMISGDNGVVISQDPKVAGSTTVLRSNDQATGAEYTWTTWLNFTNMINAPTATYKHIFNKGNGIYAQDTGLATVNNGPGLYISSPYSGTGEKVPLTMFLVVDTVDEATRAQTLTIKDIPYNKWVHVAVRLENNVIDVYVGGKVSGRLLLNSVIKQNYNDIQVCQNGGFPGYLSDLRYFSRALSAFEINNIVAYGPNTSASSLSAPASTAAGSKYFLSNRWYSDKV